MLPAGFRFNTTYCKALTVYWWAAAPQRAARVRTGCHRATIWSFTEDQHTQGSHTQKPESRAIPLFRQHSSSRSCVSPTFNMNINQHQLIHKTLQAFFNQEPLTWRNIKPRTAKQKFTCNATVLYSKDVTTRKPQELHTKALWLSSGKLNCWRINAHFSYFNHLKMHISQLFNI